MKGKQRTLMSWAVVVATVVALVGLSVWNAVAENVTDSFSVTGASLGVTFPDGSTRIFSRTEPASDLPSGAVVEVLAGTAEITAGGFTFSAGPGSCLGIAVNPETGELQFSAVGGSAVVTIGGSTITLDAGEVAQVSVDPETGQIAVASVEGTIEVATEDGTTELAAGETTDVTTPAAEVGDDDADADDAEVEDGDKDVEPIETDGTNLPEEEEEEEDASDYTP